jgi:protein involved in polysaccharide export with SLBB domain
MLSRTLTCLLAILGLAGCSSGGFSEREADVSASRFEADAAPGPSERSPDTNSGGGGAAAAASSDYQLKPRDQVIFEMFNEPDVKTTQRLSSKGEMTLPLIGAVNLAGMSLRQAEQTIRERYEEGGYYTDPQVILSVAEYGAHYVQVLGQVNRPNRIELPIEATSIGLMDAITQAGGFTRLAKTNAVRITRQTARGAERHFTVDVRDFLGSRGGYRAEEFVLQPGDVVFVPERII